MISAERHARIDRRTFYAVKVDLSKEGFNFLQDIKQKLSTEKIRWTDPGNFHITLKFIGETSPEILDRVKIALDEACSLASPFKISVSGLGIFRSVFHPRVLWLGIKDGSGISALKDITGLKTGKFLKSDDHSGYTPHLTIGRMKKIDQHESLVRLLEDYKDAEFAEAVFREIIYYESILSASGPEYRIISVHPFKKGSHAPATQDGKNGIE